MTLVVDASIACKWFVEEAGSERAAALLSSDEGLIAPDLILPEVGNALWRKLRAGQVTSAQAADAVEALADFFDDLVSGTRLAARAFAIAETLDHPVYGCFYLALAEQSEARLVTADTRLLARLAKTEWAGWVALVEEARLGSA